MRRVPVILLVFALLGCGSSQHADLTGLESPPSDFAVAVTVVSPDPGSDAPRALRPARYIVEPDGVLRVALGSGSDADTYPPRTRRLSKREYERVWRAVRETGLLDPDHPARIGDASDAPVSPRRPGATVYVAAGGERGYWLVALDGSGADASGARLLVDRLAALAWMPE